MRMDTARSTPGRMGLLASVKSPVLFAVLSISQAEKRDVM